MAVIEVENLYFGYERKRDVLKGINLAIAEDMFPLAIVGPNGSGKTTLLRNLLGIVKPRKGRVVVAGHNVIHLSGKKRAQVVGGVFAHSVNVARIPVIDVVLSGLYRDGSPLGGYPESAIKMADNVMDLLEITYLKYRLFSTLSSGERQLVLLAMVLVQEPLVLFLDEPTSFLDPYHRYILADIFKTRLRDHKIVFTSHDIEFIGATAPFSVGIKDGKITYAGETSKFLQEGFKQVFEISFNEYVGIFRL